jgi:hypothetical protein
MPLGSERGHLKVFPPNESVEGIVLFEDDREATTLGAIRQIRYSASAEQILDWVKSQTVREPSWSLKP